MNKKDNDATDVAPGGNKLIVIAVLTICLIVITLVFFLILGKITGKSQSTRSQNNSSNKTPAGNLGISTDWNKFKSIHNYSILYPAFFTLLDEQNKNEINQKHYSWQENDEAVIQFLEPDSLQRKKPYGITIVLKPPQDNPDNSTVNDWMKKRFPALRLVTTHKLKFANFEAIAVKPLGLSVSYIYISHQQKIYQIVKIIETASKSESASTANLYDYESVFEQMLATLEFED